MEPDVLEKIFEAGANICRLNFSHSDHAFQKKIMDNINLVRSRNKKFENIAVLLDTKGPEIRTGKLKNKNRVFLKKNNYLKITTNF